MLILNSGFNYGLWNFICFEKDLFMSVFFLFRLVSGDVIGVIVFFFGVFEYLYFRLEFVIKNLKKRGYQVCEGCCLCL